MTVIAILLGCQRKASVNCGTRTDTARESVVSQLAADLVERGQRAGLVGIVVVRHGELVAEAYADGVTGETLHDVRSVGKSITSLLVGIAIDRGLIRGVDDPIGRYLPELGEEKSRITIRDLLTMRSGLAADDRDPSSPGNEERLDRAQDWLAFVRGLPMTAPPGAEYRYASVNAFLAGAVVEAASGMPLDQFARRHLFEPLAIEAYEWRRGPGGYVTGQGNLSISARSAAAIGKLVLDGGGELVSARWVDEMLASHVPIGNVDLDAAGYGFMWYGTHLVIDGHRIAVRFASGNGGNKIYVVPDYESVIVITSSAYDLRWSQARSREILESLLKVLG